MKKPLKIRIDPITVMGFIGLGLVSIGVWVNVGFGSAVIAFGVGCIVYASTRAIIQG